MQEQPKLVGCRPGAGRAIRRQMGLPGLDMVFDLAAPAIEILVEPASVAFAQIGDDEAGVRSFRARFDAGDDPLDPAPACAPSKNSLKRRSLPSRGAASKLAFVLASRPSTWRRNVAVGAVPRI